VPALTRFTELSARSIVATSLAVIALASIGGVGAAAWHGHDRVGHRAAVRDRLGGGVAARALIAARVAGPRLQQGFAVVSAWRAAARAAWDGWRLRCAVSPRSAAAAPS
jgi:uncharacterized membrane protein YfcA